MPLRSGSRIKIHAFRDGDSKYPLFIITKSMQIVDTQLYALARNYMNEPQMIGSCQLPSIYGNIFAPFVPDGSYIILECASTDYQ